ncbi:unnamed protein product [Allacma fusca]|uniref:RRM domain-containing protein n=1 Tax=Allacma fusca TaxID=39272 RepID=A0A8J2LGV4_9HEXA|nr:unnamed protein product [Allacma fusca]
MVYLHFPSNLTDEELMLQTKYQKLRKKKKALTDMKAPKVEPEKTNMHKRPLDPKDAKELAKKLILAGKVSIPKKPEMERTTFKRSRVFERKLGSSVRSDVPYGSGGQEAVMTPAGDAIQFEPFTPSAPVAGERVEKEGFEKSPSSSPVAKAPRFNSFRGNFTPQRENIYESPRHGQGNTFNKPKRGPTLYIHGHGITEQFLKDLCGKYGKVVSVKMNSTSKGFVTFDKVESAEKCVQEVNGTVQDDIQLEVQFARRQPAITGGNDGNASSSWQTLATNQSQKGTHQDKRAAVVYDEPF